MTRPGEIDATGEAYRPLVSRFGLIGLGAAVVVVLCLLLPSSQRRQDVALEVLPDDEFLQRPRMSRILYRGSLFDYPLTLRGSGFRARLALLRANPLCFLGFGLTFALVFWLPCCGVLLLPVGVAAATWLLPQLEASTQKRAR